MVFEKESVFFCTEEERHLLEDIKSQILKPYNCNLIN